MFWYLKGDKLAKPFHLTKLPCGTWVIKGAQPLKAQGISVVVIVCRVFVVILGEGRECLLY